MVVINQGGCTERFGLVSFIVVEHRRVSSLDTNYVNSQY